MIINYRNYFRNRPHKFDYDINSTNLRMSFFHSQLQLSLRKANKSLANASVLEIGSGEGALAKLICQEDVKAYTGIELDNSIVEFCNLQISNNFLNASLSDYCKNCAEKYDFIFAFETLEHFENPLEELSSISELLNDKGTFIGTTPYPFKKNVLADDTHLYVLHPLNWKRLFEIMGFTKVTVSPMTFFPFLWRVNKALNVVIPFYCPFKYVISTTLIVANKGTKL